MMMLFCEFRKTPSVQMLQDELQEHPQIHRKQRTGNQCGFGKTVQGYFIHVNASASRIANGGTHLSSALNQKSSSQTGSIEVLLPTAGSSVTPVGRLREKISTSLRLCSSCNSRRRLNGSDGSEASYLSRRCST